MIIIHQTNNVLIARFVALEEVTSYEAAYKYLSIFLMLFVIMTNQYWSASIEAYRKGDLEWMKSTIQSVQKVWLGTLVICALMVIISPIFFRIWLQGKLEISFMLTVSVAVSVCITNWVNMFNLILNGAGKIRLQMYTWIAASLLNIPISIFLATFLGWGTIGIVLGTVFSMIPLAVLSPFQVRKILNRSETGIWAK